MKRRERRHSLENRSQTTVTLSFRHFMIFVKELESMSYMKSRYRISYSASFETYAGYCYVLASSSYFFMIVSTSLKTRELASLPHMKSRWLNVFRGTRNLPITLGKALKTLFTF
jgi:hypothetical protein